MPITKEGETTGKSYYSEPFIQPKDWNLITALLLFVDRHILGICVFIFFLTAILCGIITYLKIN